MASLGADTLPSHVGIIMDGNGRWAKKRGLPRTSGHKEGLETAKQIVARAADLGIKNLSLYTFSTENWRRAVEEVDFLMNLIKSHLRKQYDFYEKRGIRITHSGNLEGIPPMVRDEIFLVEEKTSGFDKLRLNLLINYGGRDEIVRAVRRYFENGGRAENLTERTLSSNLDQPDQPELDLMIRTGGEFRLSNFLLWQSAYAEFYFSATYWPDWTPDDFDKAVKHYNLRDRRRGGAE